MSRTPARMFLERATYRRRRLRDAARLLPVVGALLFLVPLLWAPDRDESAATAGATIYVFAVWAGLILAALAMSRALARPDPADGPGAARDQAE